MCSFVSLSFQYLAEALLLNEALEMRVKGTGILSLRVSVCSANSAGFETMDGPNEVVSQRSKCHCGTSKNHQAQF